MYEWKNSEWNEKSQAIKKHELKYQIRKKTND